MVHTGRNAGGSRRHELDWTPEPFYKCEDDAPGILRKLVAMTDTPLPSSVSDRTRRPFDLDEGVAILTRTPATIDALLRGLPDGWILAHEGGQTWSPFDVVGHLI